jgi:hypothetical protein
MKRRAFLVLAGLGGLGLLACHKSDDLKRLTVDDVSSLLAKNDGQTVVYDCNAREHFAKEHLPGAKWVEYDGVTAADLPAEKGMRLVFYCASEL